MRPRTRPGWVRGAHELNEVDSGVDDSAAASLFPRDYLRVVAAIEAEADE